ncbi:MAG: AgmX/PglI C-terminal domain-containing protein, partial [Bacteriovoracaceae bacterium]|nr:AgmX/PglI C-terminal domain-containing protein [Bacteriovoracaceae bacterium]
KKKNLKKAPAKQKRVAKALKVKQYKFKSKSFTALLGSSKNIKQVKLNTKQDSTLGNESTLTASTSNLKTTDISAVGKLGRDSRGNESTSYGAKGLASKRGIDTAYVAPKTVVLGSMDPELLRKILREYLPQFKHCYQEELESYSENIKGVVNLDFRIGAAGRVISSSINARRAKFSKKGVGCMNKVLRLIEFPKPKGGGVVDVRQPLNFFSERTKY